MPVYNRCSAAPCPAMLDICTLAMCLVNSWLCLHQLTLGRGQGRVLRAFCWAQLFQLGCFSRIAASQSSISSLAANVHGLQDLKEDLGSEGEKASSKEKRGWWSNLPFWGDEDSSEAARAEAKRKAPFGAVKNLL